MVVVELLVPRLADAVEPRGAYRPRDVVLVVVVLVAVPRVERAVPLAEAGVAYVELALDEAGGLSMKVVSVVKIEVSPSLVGESGSGWEVASASLARRNESGIGASGKSTQKAFMFNP